ncbi:MAG: hypothetical protein KatS3mg102_2297 [Planctomycetota bacterium]|nr:MAG: hypothetical protein KatS3mg102_2297 [Planctomycetota bacterium]
MSAPVQLPNENVRFAPVGDIRFSGAPEVGLGAGS